MLCLSSAGLQDRGKCLGWLTASLHEDSMQAKLDGRKSYQGPWKEGKGTQQDQCMDAD